MARDTTRELTVNISEQAAHLVWSMSFDDDDVAGYLLDLSVYHTMGEMYKRLCWAYTEERRSRLATAATLLGEDLRLLEGEMAQRMSQYNLAEHEEEPPF